MTFQPQQYLGRGLPNLIADLAQVDPQQLPTALQGRVSPHHATMVADDTIDVIKLRPEAFLTTVVDSHLPLEHPDITVPDVVLDSFLGGGTQGWVYSGQVRSTGKTVAVKVIRSDFEETRKAVAREARICAGIRHYHILRVFEVQSAGSFWVVLMELVQGDQLGKKPMDDATFRACFAALADATAALADRNIVHRDIKPANILIRTQDRSPVLVDFGLALDLNAPDDHDPSRVCGTPLFMPPEAFGVGAMPQPAWDAYALGVTAAMTLLGKIPSPAALDTLWESKRTGKFQNSLHQSLDGVRDLEIREWIRTLTDADPSRRGKGLELAMQWRAS